MSDDKSDVAAAFIEIIRSTGGPVIDVREILTAGKSGAYVALVDCVGFPDGVFVLKVDSIPVGWDDEEDRHKRAIAQRAFSGRVPEILIAKRTSTHYCLLQKLAGGSRLTWRPLTKSLRLFHSAYATFSRLSWTPNLFN